MVDRTIVEYSAKLAKIELGDGEAEGLQATLGALLDYVDGLKNVDTAGFDGNGFYESEGGFNAASPPRLDALGDSWEREAILGNAPVRNEDSFVVPDTF